MKKFIKTFIIALCLVLPTLCLTACDNAEHEHNFATVWSSDANYHYHVCTGDDCEEITDKEAHTFGEWTTSTKATCTTEGEKYRACLECGYKETQEISATGHTFGEFVIDETPTTQSAGEGHRECSVCHKISRTTISALKSTGLLFELNSDKASYILTGIGTCTDSFVNVPNTHNGLPVTAIKNEAFGGNTTITGIVLTNNITTIGHHAFTNCSNLTNITIPNSVTNIEEYAFSNCSKLTSVTIPNNLTSIEEGVFWGCSSLTSIIIPNSVTTLGNSAFSSCESLETVVIPNSVTTLGIGVFNNCKNLTSAVVGNGITTLSNNTFSGCKKLTSVTIGSEVTTIGKYAFENCVALRLVTIPDGVTTIEESAFFQCEGLVDIIIPNNVTTIGQNAFAGCKGATSIVLGSRVTTLGVGAFYRCTNVTSVIIPNSVRTIGALAFDTNTSLEKTYYVGTEEQWSLLTNNIGKDNDCLTGHVYFLSETQPTTEGNYWHYVDGVPTEWKNLTLEVNAKTGENALTYGDTISYTASDVVATGLVNGETIDSLGTLSFVYSTEENGIYTSTLPKNVGTYYVKVAGCVSNKYNITYTAGTLEIKKARLTITVSNRTGDKALTYGDNPEYSTDFITLSGLKYDDTISSAGKFEFEYKLSTSSNYSPTLPKDVGTYSVMSNITNSTNYTSTYVEGTLEIQKAILTVTIPNVECPYGTIKGCETTITGFKYGEYRESDPEDKNPNKITIEGNAKLYNPVTGDEIPTNGPSSYIAVGTYQYRPYYTAKNYDFEYVPGSTYIIKPKEIKIKANPDLEVHSGDELTASNIRYYEVDGSDRFEWDNNLYIEAMITGTLSFTTNYKKGDPAGNYTIKAQGLTCGSSNYTIVYLETTFEVLA